MNSLDENLRRGQVAFMGQIVAAATHEFQNHFAVIKEYNGLIADLLRSKQAGKRGTIKRCREIGQNIDERAGQAALLAERLNRFAHRGDVAPSSVKMEVLVDDLVALLQRSAAQRRVSLSAESSGGLPETLNDAALLQFMLGSVTLNLLETLGENGSIALSVIPGAADGGVAVEIAAEGPAAAESEGQESGLIDACLQRLNARFSSSPGDGRLVVRFEF